MGNGDAESPCGLEINDQLELGGLLDWQVTWFRTLQDLVDVPGRSTPLVRVVDSVRQ